MLNPALLLIVAGILSASQFAADLRRSGPRDAVGHLVAGGDWPRVMAAIRVGAADWIALAPDIARGAGPEQGTDLSAALAAALPRAPAEVLAVADTRRSPILGLQAICSAPAGSHPEGKRGQYLADAQEALELLPDVAAIGKAKAVCLRELALAAGH